MNTYFVKSSYQVVYNDIQHLANAQICDERMLEG